MSVQEDSSDDELDGMTTEFVAMIEDLDEPDRAVILTELASRFCMSCGSNLPKDGSDCACGSDEDEDEDDEEDLDDEDDEDDEDEEDLDDEDDEDDDSGDDGDPDEEDPDAD